MSIEILGYCKECRKIFSLSEVKKYNKICPDCGSKIMSNKGPTYKKIAIEWYQRNYGL